jgi:hypothetical protein
MNEYPVGGLIVSQQNRTVKQQRQGCRVHKLRDRYPLSEPVDHIFCLHRNRIQATQETRLKNNWKFTV